MHIIYVHADSNYACVIVLPKYVVATIYGHYYAFIHRYPKMESGLLLRYSLVKLISV